MATLHEHQQITVCRNYNLEFKKFYYNSMKKYNEHPNIIIKKKWARHGSTAPQKKFKDRIVGMCCMSGKARLLLLLKNDY